MCCARGIAIYANMRFIYFKNTIYVECYRSISFDIQLQTQIQKQTQLSTSITATAATAIRKANTIAITNAGMQGTVLYINIAENDDI